jgi:hypothetical protein
MIFNLSRQRTKVEKVFALLFLALFFGLQALVASPVLHKCLHHDADQADHECAVTLLAHGNCEIASDVPVLITPSSFVPERTQAPVSPVLEVDYQLLPGRAPPSVRA